MSVKTCTCSRFDYCYAKHHKVDRYGDTLPCRRKAVTWVFPNRGYCASCATEVARSILDQNRPLVWALRWSEAQL